MLTEQNVIIGVSDANLWPMPWINPSQLAQLQRWQWYWAIRTKDKTVAWPEEILASTRTAIFVRLNLIGISALYRGRHPGVVIH